MENTKIYLVRHGESVGNLNRVCLGHTDLSLTEKGLLQAQTTCEALKDIKIDAVYSSDLQRAYFTALPHAELRGLDVIKMQDFRELYFGDWENASIAELTEIYKEQFVIGWRTLFGTFTPPNGESVVDMADRIAAGLKKIASDNMGKTILVASHAAAIRALWGKISGNKPEDWALAHPFPSNASYSIIEYDGERLIPKEYSCDSHLGELATYIPADISVPK